MFVACEQIKTGNLCMNLTLRCVSVTNSAAENQEILHIMSVCLYACIIYPACRLHLFCAPLYCHLWPVWLYHNFLQLTHKRHDFRQKKNVFKIKFVFIFSINLSKIFINLRIIQRGVKINVHKSSCKVAVILV